METVKTFDPIGWTLETAVRLKRGRTVSVCIPCHDEADTIGDLVRLVEPALLGTLVDELIVLDDDSTDGTADVAAQAGATVVPIGRIHETHGAARGKGNALWASLLASRGDIVVWIDGDITSFSTDWIVRLVIPLLEDERVGLVKATYARPEHLGGGGRTTELVARPLLSMFFPGLAALQQPLAGEYAGRRSMLEAIPFSTGWGVEVGMLIDMAARFGLGSIGQVDLGVRLHRHHCLKRLAIQGAEVAAAVLMRTPHPPAFADETPRLHSKTGAAIALNVGTRPPIATLEGTGEG